MIKKDLFVETINFLKKKDNFQTKMNNIFTKEFGDCVLYPYDGHTYTIINLLAASFDYDDNIIKDWIEYYIYELYYGEDWKPNTVTETRIVDGKEIEVDIPLKTPEDLYDMLFKTACGDKINEKE
jgi:hypothetical protein